MGGKSEKRKCYATLSEEEEQKSLKATRARPRPLCEPTETPLLPECTTRVKSRQTQLASSINDRLFNYVHPHGIWRDEP